MEEKRSARARASERSAPKPTTAPEGSATARSSADFAHSRRCGDAEIEPTGWVGIDPELAFDIDAGDRSHVDAEEKSRCRVRRVGFEARATASNSQGIGAAALKFAAEFSERPTAGAK